MRNRILIPLTLTVGLALLSVGCTKKAKANKEAEGSTGPVPTTVVSDMDANRFTVKHPERFPLAVAGERISSPELNVTCSVTPDVSTQVPVPSLATGRIVEIDARLGDEVKKDQLLFKVRSSDIAGAFSDYRKAVKNRELTKIQLDRAKLLYEQGAAPRSALEIAQNADDDALVDVETTTEHLRLLGSDLDHPTGIVEVHAPVSGVITDQQITNASGVMALTPPNPFTISNLSHVWIICDVYENDLQQVRLGEYADIRLNAFPERVFRGRIGNISPIMDPNIRTAKVRLEVDNPDIMRLGMFVTATFHGSVKQRYSTVPSTAILHLRDRDWVYTPIQDGTFQRLEVTAGRILPGDLQEVATGLSPGTKVVSNALVFQNTVEQ